MLYVCATPIGNLEDVTRRVLAVLGDVAVVACEDTRHTRRLLDRYSLRPLRLLSFHEHNEATRVEEILGLLRGGTDVALVSDAGMPGLSDPGFRLIRACAAEGLALTVLPGPSAVSTALVASGMPTDRFLFLGFLPRGKKHVVAALDQADLAMATLVGFESPRRIRPTLAIVAERWPDRQVAVCRELTKVHEEVLRGTAAEVAEQLAGTVRGEIVLVLEPATERSAGGRVGGGPGLDAEVMVARLLAEGLGTKAVAGIVADLTGLPAREVYQMAVTVKSGGRRDPEALG